MRFNGTIGNYFVDDKFPMEIDYLSCTDNWCRHWTDKKYKTLFNDDGIRKGREND